MSVMEILLHTYLRQCQNGKTEQCDLPDSGEFGKCTSFQQAGGEASAVVVTKIDLNAFPNTGFGVTK